MKTIRWAAIGCGSVCEVKSLPAMYKLPFSEVKGVYARNQERAADFVARHGLPKVYTSVEALLQDPEVDIVYIATPPASHREYTLAALDAGKHVYVEKPMGINYVECAEMHNYALARGLRLFVAHYRRALPYFIKVRALLQGGEIGKLLTVHMEQFKPVSPDEMQHDTLPWRLQAELSGGGHFYDLAPHAVDIMEFLVDDTYREIHGFATNRGQWYTVEDTVSATFSMQGGLLGTAQWSFVAAPECRKDTITVVGTEGSITCSVFSFHPIRLHTARGIEEMMTEHPQHIQMPLVQTILEDLNDMGKCPSSSATALSTAWAMDRILGKI